MSGNALSRAHARVYCVSLISIYSTSAGTVPVFEGHNNHTGGTSSCNDAENWQNCRAGERLRRVVREARA